MSVPDLLTLTSAVMEISGQAGMQILKLYQLRAKLPGALGVELAVFLVPFSIVQYMPNLFYGSLLCAPPFFFAVTL
jgi:hypothetical protein